MSSFLVTDVFEMLSSKELDIEELSVAVPFGVHSRFLVGKLLIYGEVFQCELFPLLVFSISINQRIA